MKCRDALERDWPAIEVEATVRAAAQALQRHQVEVLSVCDQQGRVIGTVSEARLRSVDARPGATAMSVGYMLEPVSGICRPDDELEAVREAMRRTQTIAMPVADQRGVYLGMVRREPRVRGGSAAQPSTDRPDLDEVMHENRTNQDRRAVNRGTSGDGRIVKEFPRS